MDAGPGRETRTDLRFLEGVLTSLPVDEVVGEGFERMEDGRFGVSRAD